MNEPSFGDVFKAALRMLDDAGDQADRFGTADDRRLVYGYAVRLGLGHRQEYEDACGGDA